jgi:ATP-dependent RNA helicase DeaD
VLDEADEMLRMGFIDDVERILQETPETRQTALFSATMPPAISRIAKTYLREPKEVTVAAKTTTATNITQRYWLVAGLQKLEALTRILEAEPFDGMIIFARTKLGTEELATKLQARGFAAAAINGDLAQQQRERTIEQLKKGKIDILVATDVAARGLDVERISHVINYDVPSDPESYTHRIGRTGRAGRSGDAILFVTPRERGMLKAIERATRQPVAQLTLPTIKAVNDVRIAKFKDQIGEALAAGGLDMFRSLIEEYERETQRAGDRHRRRPGQAESRRRAAAAREAGPRAEAGVEGSRMRREARPARAGRESFGRDSFGSDERPARPTREGFAQPRESFKKERVMRAPEAGMATYRIEVGHANSVKPGNIVGAIANEGGIPSKEIGRIEIYDDYSTLDMPADLPQDLLSHLQKVWVAGRQLNITRDGEEPIKSAPKKKFGEKKPHRKG